MKWFKHYCNASLELPVSRVLAEQGYYGVGVMWTLIERLNMYEGFFTFKEAKLLFVCKRYATAKLIALLNDYQIFSFDETTGIIHFHQHWKNLLDGKTKDRPTSDRPLPPSQSMPVASVPEQPASSADPQPENPSPATGQQTVCSTLAGTNSSEQGYSKGTANGQQTPPNAPARENENKNKNKKNANALKKRPSLSDLVSNASTPEEKEFYENMMATYPNVCSLAAPLSWDEYKRLRRQWPPDKIAATLRSMENCRTLAKKYISANLTLQKWIVHE